MDNPSVIYEDKNLLAVNKPAGLLVHQTRISDIRRQRSDIRSPKSEIRHPTLVDWLMKKYPEIATVGDDPKTRPGIVHRLDRETSGVMLVAKNQRSFDYLKSLFQKHLIKKIYLALVFGKVDQKGRIEKPIGMKSGSVKRTIHSTKMSKEAATDYRLKQLFGSHKTQFSLVEVEPQTGRTHQIRVHFASIGHPVVGDTLYGPKPGARCQVPGARLMLHALSLELPLAEDMAYHRQEVGRRLRVEAELPVDYQAALETLSRLSTGGD